MSLEFNKEIYIKSEPYDDPLPEHDINDFHEEIDIKSEVIEEHDTKFESNNVNEIVVEDIKPFEFVEVKTESLFAEPVTDNFLTCGNCNATIMKQRLNAHLPCSRIKKASHFCEKCDNVYNSKEALHYHVQSFHLGLQPFKCDTCKKCFVVKKSLSRHLKGKCSARKQGLNAIEKVKPYSCGTCEIKYQSKQALEYHIKSFHLRLKPFKCDICNKCFTMNSDLNKHLKRHLNRKSICSKQKVRTVCEICNKIVAKKDLKLHSQAVHQECKLVEDVKPFEFIELKTEPLFAEPLTDSFVSCENCNATFMNESRLNAHLPCSNIQKASHFCEECDNVYHSKEALQYHIKSFHIRLKPFKCDTCSKCFVMKGDLNKHLNIHSRPTELNKKSKSIRYRKIKRSSCEICNKIVLNRNLKLHIQAFHQENKPYKCDVCSKSFKVKRTLLRHIILTHLSEKSYKCLICDKSLRSKDVLKEHLIKVHKTTEKNSNDLPKNLPPAEFSKYIIDEKTLTCVTCNKKYKKLNSLKYHLKTAHESLKPFHCTICSKQFAAVSNLKCHLTKHLDKKPYKCSFCSKDYKWRKGFKLHLINVHNVAGTEWPTYNSYK